MGQGFHPLYRGTWFPTKLKSAKSWTRSVSIRYIAVLGFQPSGTSRRACADMFPSAISRYLVSNHRWHPTPLLRRSCFHPLYRGTWFPTSVMRWTACGASLRFHPLYRGTWFPTMRVVASITMETPVSIRYIAVLGFQQLTRLIQRNVLSAFPSAISRYLVSNSITSRLSYPGRRVSIRYIAVLGFQQ